MLKVYLARQDTSSAKLFSLKIICFVAAVKPCVQLSAVISMLGQGKICRVGSSASPHPWSFLGGRSLLDDWRFPFPVNEEERVVNQARAHTYDG